MARLVYACKFEIPTTPDANPAILAYENWLTHHYRQRRGIQDFSCDLRTSCVRDDLPNGHALKTICLIVHSEAATLVDWAFPDFNDSTLRWRNEIRIGNFDGSCSVEHLIWIESVEYHLSPAQFQLGSPSVIQQLCTDQTVHVGEMQIRGTPYPLRVDGIEKFIELLRSPLRRLPIVFLAPFADGEVNLIDAQAMAKRLAGVAIVVSAQEVDATWEIAEKIGRTLSCFNGGVRTYWPGFKETDDPRRHPLFLGSKVAMAQTGAVSRSIERTIFAVASFRYVSDGRIDQIVKIADQTQRALHLESQRASKGADWEAYALELDGQLTASKLEVSNLKSEIKNLRDNREILFGDRASYELSDDISPDEIVVPKSMSEAVKLAREKFANIIVLESAVKSADASPFLRPAEVADALKELDGVAANWVMQKSKIGNGGDLRQHLIKAGWGKRCSMQISDTTKSRYKSDYTFQYEGQPKLVEPHITLGAGDANSCASIHFFLDEKLGKVVVAHVGRHLRNTRT